MMNNGSTAIGYEAYAGPVMTPDEYAAWLQDQEARIAREHREHEAYMRRWNRWYNVAWRWFNDPDRYYGFASHVGRFLITYVLVSSVIFSVLLAYAYVLWTILTRPP